MNDYQPEVIPREMRREIAKEFRDYFERRHMAKLKPREARMMIDYVNGPSPPMTSDTAIDYTRAQVSGGGGYPRPTTEQIETIYEKYDILNDELSNIWDAVFEELLQQYYRYSGTVNFIHLVFRDGHSQFVICDELNIGRTTYYRHRRTILEQAGMIALKKGVLKH